MTTQLRLLARADAGPGVGAGHVGRTLAIAEAWRNAGGVAMLASDRVPADWEDRWEAAGCEVIAAAGGDVDPRPDVLVIDGYPLPPSDLLATWPARPLLQVDDHAFSREHDLASIVVDQNLGAKAEDYSVPASTRLLLGPRYALVRSATARAAANRLTPRLDGDVVVFLGGSPPSALRREVGVSVDAIRAAGHGVTYAEGSVDVPAAFADAKLAIITAGSTAWDLAAIGVPMVVMATSDNQVPVATRLSAMGAAESVDLERGPAALAVLVERLLRDDEARLALAHRARGLVDGRGAQRVATALRACLIAVRRVDVEDASTLWEWANDPVTRASAFDPDPIPWEHHVEWMGDKLRDKRTCMLMGRDSEGLLGQVRIDLLAGVGEIDLTVAPERRGQGWAGPLLSAALPAAASVLHRLGLRVFTGRVKHDNPRSARAFIAADFDEADNDGREGTWRTFRKELEGGIVT